MKEQIKIVRDHYDQCPEHEFNRIVNRPEFLLTCRMLDRYIKPGDTVLDIGGGPGRYSFYLAEKGCGVTLFDLSDENIRFAREYAAENGVALRTVCGNACEADTLLAGEEFDHVLLMGPLYHLVDESDRVRAVEAAINLLKPGGTLFCSFISSYAAMLDGLARNPVDIFTKWSDVWFKVVKEDTDFSGFSFTESYMINPKGVDGFMGRFGLVKLHTVNCESILYLREKELMAEEPEILQKWIDFAYEICEREEFMAMATHFLYIGRKNVLGEARS
jgi:2-polyprenyl-3-methyl-5-hydroxy-6-metoxy-1,4-benzoquinol methylase